MIYKNLYMVYKLSYINNTQINNYCYNKNKKRMRCAEHLRLRDLSWWTTKLNHLHQQQGGIKKQNNNNKLILTFQANNLNKLYTVPTQFSCIHSGLINNNAIDHKKLTLCTECS